MNRKTLDNLFWIFTLLPFFIAIPLLFILPETVPIHWTEVSQGPDGYGSKYIILLILVMFFISSFFVKTISHVVEEGNWTGNTKIDRTIAKYLPLFVSFFLLCASLWIFWLITSTSLFS